MGLRKQAGFMPHYDSPERFTAYVLDGSTHATRTRCWSDASDVTVEAADEAATQARAHRSSLLTRPGLSPMLKLPRPWLLPWPIPHAIPEPNT